MLARGFFCLATALSIAAVLAGPHPLLADEGASAKHIEALRGDDATARVEAARTLGRLGAEAEAAIPALRERLEDADAAVRGQAAVALWRIEGDLAPVLPSLIAARRAGDPAVRAEAAAAWAEIGPGVRTVLPYISEMLRRGDLQSTQKAAETLGKHGVEAVPALLDLLAEPRRSNSRTSTDPRVRAFAVDALARFGPSQSPVFVEALQDPHPAVREGAAQVLGRIGREAPEAMPALIEALEDRDAQVRQRAIESLGRLEPGAPDLLPALTAALGHLDPAVRRGAVAALSKLGPRVEEAAPALRKSLADPEPQVRLQAAGILSQFDPPVPEALQTLLEEMKGRDIAVRQLASEALERLGPRAKILAPSLKELAGGGDVLLRVHAARVLWRLGPEYHEAALRPLTATLQDADPGLRVGAADALWDMGRYREALPTLLAALKRQDSSGSQARQILQRNPRAKDVVPVLAEALQDQDPQVRVQILSVLRGLGSAAGIATPAVLPLLRNEDASVRSAAASALQQMGGPPKEAVPALVALLKEKDNGARYQAARMLGQLGAEAGEAAPALVAMMKDPDAGIRRQAVQVLRQIGSAEAVVPALVAALDDEDANVRTQVAQVLGQLGPAAKGAAPALVKILQDPEPRMRLQALQTLRQIGAGSESSVEALVACLEDEDANVRLQAAQALGQLGPAAAAAAPALAGMLKDPQPNVRAQAARLLIQLAPVRGAALVPTLLEALQSEDAEVRAPAAQALAGIGYPAKEAAPALREALRDDDSRVRINAAEALMKIDPSQAADLQPVLLASLKASEQAVQLQAIRLLRSRTDGLDSDTITALGEAIDDEDANIRMQAAEMLISAPPEKPEAKAAFSALVELLGHPQSNMRSQAVQHLASWPAPDDVIPVLAKALKDTDATVRYNAATRLGQLGAAAGAAAAPIFQEALREGDVQTRMQMAHLARQSSLLDAETLTAALVPLLGDPNLGIRQQAMNHLIQLGPQAESAVPALTDLLQSENSPARTQAAQVLARINPSAKKTAFAALLEELKRSDGAQRLNLVRTLSSLDPATEAETVVPVLIGLLEDSDGNVRGEAVQLLGRLGDAAKPALLAVRASLESGADPTFRRFAALALVEISPAEAQAAAPALTALLSDPLPSNRLQAARALSRLGSREAEAAFAALSELVDDPEPSTRFGAAQALAQMGPEGIKLALPAMAAIVEDSRAGAHHGSAMEAMRQLGTAGHKALFHSLMTLLRDPQIQRRSQAISSLRRLDYLDAEIAVPVLIERLDDPHSSVKHEAIRCLGILGPNADGAIPALVEVLREGDEQSVAAVMDTLPQLNHASIGPLLEVLAEGEIVLRPQMLYRLGRLGPAAAPLLPRLVEMLSETDDRNRRMVAGVLGQIGADAAPALVKALEHENPTVRRAAADSLAQIGARSKAGGPALTKALEDPELPVRVAAARALWAVERSAQTSAVVPRLREGLEKGDVPLRRAIAETIATQAPPPAEFVPLLELALRDEDSWMRVRAAVPLCREEGYVKKAAALLTEALEDNQHRHHAVSWIWLAGPAAKDALPALSTMLADPSSSIASRAATALTRIGGPEAIPLLMKQFDAADPVRTALITEALGSIHPAGLAPLAKLAGHESPGVRYLAVRSMASLVRASPDAIPVVLRSLKDEDRNVRHAAIQVLGAAGPEGKQAVAPLAALLKDEDEHHRREAAISLARLGAADEEVLAVLTAAAREAPVLTRLRAVEVMGILGPSAVPVLREALGDSGGIPAEAAKALSRMGPAARPAAPELRDALRSAHSTTRAYAALALWKIEGQIEKVAPVLVHAVQDYQSLSIRHTNVQPYPGAVESGGRYAQAPSMSSPSSAAVAAWSNPRVELIRALGEIGPPARAAVPALSALSKNANPEIRKAVAASLKKIEP